MSREELKPSEWAPERIYLQREHGEGGSHTWCEDSVGDGDLIEEAEYVRVGAQDVARAPEGAVELLRKFMEYRDSDYVPNVLFDRARTIIDFAPAAPAVVPYSAPFTTDVPQCCESPETCDEPCWNPQYDIQEAREILENMVRNVESGGNYSENTTCCFLRQALQCLPLAAPAQAEQQGDGGAIVELQHVAVAEDGGKLRWLSGRRPRDCELFAMRDGGLAPTKLYTHAPVEQPSARAALSTDQILEIATDHDFDTDTLGSVLEEFARAILVASEAQGGNRE